MFVREKGNWVWQGIFLFLASTYSRTVVLNLVFYLLSPPSPGTFGKVWRHFCLSQLGGKLCYWHIPQSPGVPLCILQHARQYPTTKSSDHNVSSARVEALQPFSTMLFFPLFPCPMLFSQIQMERWVHLARKARMLHGPQAISLCSQSIVGESLAISFLELSDSLIHLWDLGTQRETRIA